MSFPGFDCSAYPSDATMLELVGAGLAWCGYYLAPAPNHGDLSWSGKRAMLLGQGWGFAPVYVGQQLDDGTGRLSSILTTAQGTADGQNAAQLAQNEGFPLASILFLDIESGGPLTQPIKDYALAWTVAVTAAGYSPGFYCSYLVLADLRALVPGASFWIFRLRPLGATDPIYSPPFPTNPLTDSGSAGIAVWQYAQNTPGVAATQIQLPSGTNVPADMDLSISADPSAPPMIAPAERTRGPTRS